jgi:hypothetical protein
VAPSPFFQQVRGYLAASERQEVLAELAAAADEMRRIDGRAGIGPRYAVIGGDGITASLPRVAAIGARVRSLVESFAGAPLEPFHDPIRRARVQTYTEPEDGFRWHFDGHEFVALVTIENHSNGVTELIAPRLSSLVRPLFYPAYAVPQLFSLLPRSAVSMEAGDALLFSGSGSLHRGRSRMAGRRTILVFAFDRVGAKRSRFRNWIARSLNYSGQQQKL